MQVLDWLAAHSLQCPVDIDSARSLIHALKDEKINASKIFIYLYLITNRKRV